MANVKREAALMLVLGVLSGCGGPQTTTLQAPAVQILPERLSVYAGGAVIKVYVSYAGSSDAPSWSLDGPGAISSTIWTSSGSYITYTPPTTMDSDAVATLTADYGAVQGSVTIQVHPPPFTFSPPSLTVTAGDGMTLVLVKSRDPALGSAWSVTCDGPGDVDSSPTESVIMYYPPQSIAVTTMDMVQVFTLDRYIVQSFPVTINPP